jgi:hypothetical protein
MSYGNCLKAANVIVVMSLANNWLHSITTGSVAWFCFKFGTSFNPSFQILLRITSVE